MDRDADVWKPLLLGTLAAAAGFVAVRAAVRARRRVELDGKVVLLTGGSRGLGLAMARQLVGAGARVALLARDQAELDEAERDSGAAMTVAADVADPDDCRRAVEQVASQLGPVDILINNAGVIAVGPFETQGRELFEESLDVHVRGPLELMRNVLPFMRERRAGRIVNVASIGGKVPIPHLSAYVAGKHALVGLTETARSELVRDGVYVTLVCPGLVRTGSPRHAEFTGDAEADYAWFAGGDNLPGLSLEADALAAKVIDATVHGDAELVTPFNAKVASALHGLLGGVSVELSALQARLLPRGDAGRVVTGAEADVGQLPGPLDREQRANAAAYNEA